MGRLPLRGTATAFLLALLLAIPGAARAVSVGDKAIAVTGQGLDNQVVDLGAYIGKKAILIKFGSIYCSTCVSSLEDVARIQKKFKPSDLQVVGINLDVYGIPRVRRFYRGFSSLIKYPMIVDEKTAASRPYDISSIPAHVVIDKTGVVRFVSVGASPDEIKTLEEVITKVIKGESGVEKLMKEAPLQVSLPNNFTKTYQDSLYVVGKAKAGSNLTLTLNGGSRQKITNMRNLFYIRTNLSLGSNYIEVQLTDPSGSQVNQGIVLFREPRMGTGIESPFPTYSFHNDKNEAGCKACHDLNPPEAGAQGFATATQFCLGCHKEFSGHKVVHGPIPIGGCAPCHNFASKPNRYEVKAQGQDLCFSCHEDKKKDLLRTFLHGPMSAGLCTICHSPHASSEKYTLRVYGGDMCLMCHEGVKGQLLLASVHKPVADGSCTKCHEPHSSQRNDFFVKEEGNKLCLSCHTLDKMGHNHPWGVPPRMESPIRLDKAGNLMCISCHRAHGSEEKKLLIQGGCAKCHGG